MLIARAVVFPYVHNLKQLLELVERSGEPVAQPVQSAEQLSEYAFVTRYPWRGPPVTAEQYRQAVEAAERVVRWAEQRLV